MSELIFLFGIDSIITKKPIMQLIFNKYIGNDKIYSNFISGNSTIPYNNLFLNCVDQLKDLSVSEIASYVKEIEVNEPLVNFINKYRNRCYIVTDNLDVWIHELIKKMNMNKNIYSSKASINNDRVNNVISILDKSVIIGQFVVPFVAVGKGENDSVMIDCANIGIAYGGTGNLSHSVLSCASHAIFNEKKLVEFLERLV